MDIKEVKIGDILLKKENLTKTVNTEKGIFVLKIIDPVEKKSIIRNISKSIDHAALESIPAEDYLFVKAIETLRFSIIEKPDWFVLDKCLDESLIVTLYSEFLELEESFRRLLRPN